MKKKFSLSMLLTAVAMVLIIAFGVKTEAKAADYYYDTRSDNGDAGQAVRYAITSYDDKTCQVVGCSSSATKIIISGSPTLNGETYTCTSIASSAFKNNTKLKEVKISAGATSITSIPKYCFQGCTNLTTVSLDNTKLKTISAKAFYNCKKLTSVTIKSTKLTTINTKAFYNCKKLTSLSIKSTKLTKSNIGSKAFTNVSNLKVYGNTKAYAKKLAKWIAARGGSVATYAKISS